MLEADFEAKKAGGTQKVRGKNQKSTEEQFAWKLIFWEN